jgi:hypothetical protein
MQPQRDLAPESSGLSRRHMPRGIVFGFGFTGTMAGPCGINGSVCAAEVWHGPISHSAARGRATAPPPAHAEFGGLAGVNRPARGGSPWVSLHWNRTAAMRDQWFHVRC